MILCKVFKICEIVVYMNKISHRVCVIDMVRNVFKQFGFSASADAGNDFDVWRLQYILYFIYVFATFNELQDSRLPISF